MWRADLDKWVLDEGTWNALADGADNKRIEAADKNFMIGIDVHF
jgi:hypothetical protein